ncbi:hypothetical protein [Alteromonas stellipolaris]|uniref:hypothetical protein n=1 Tax=Alteromonas stellipolaris TaxID=233316 RepID=UPI00071EE616|nr:hypothetical protein [Alteromonas stellipolaris]ALM92971.1 hypothetical protein AOR13_3979 [Alteromonas stellipolaris LMG 21856]
MTDDEYGWWGDRLTLPKVSHGFSSEGRKHHDRPSTAWMRWQNAMAGLIGS